MLTMVVPETSVLLSVCMSVCLLNEIIYIMGVGLRQNSKCRLSTQGTKDLIHLNQKFYPDSQKSKLIYVSVSFKLSSFGFHIEIYCTTYVLDPPQMSGVLLVGFLYELVSMVNKTITVVIYII